MKKRYDYELALQVIGLMDEERPKRIRLLRKLARDAVMASCDVNGMPDKHYANVIAKWLVP